MVHTNKKVPQYYHDFGHSAIILPYLWTWYHSVNLVFLEYVQLEYHVF